MKKLTQILLTCFFFAAAIMPAQAQTNEQLDEVLDLCTELIVLSSQTGSDAHRIVVFSNNGNMNQLERALEDTQGGLEGIVEGLGRLRRIPNGTITNQVADRGGAYRSRSSRMVSNLNANATVPAALSELGQETAGLMDMIKDLSMEIRAEIIEIKNSRN